MKQLFFILILAAAHLSSVYAGGTCCPRMQDSLGTKHKCATPVTRSFYLSSGGAFIRNDDVNDQLEGLGFHTFSNYALSLGVGGIRQYKRFVQGHELEALIWKRNRYGNSESDLGVGRFTALFGVSLLSNDKFSLYPLIGLGIGMTSIKAGPKEVPFDSAFAIPSQVPPASPVYQNTFLIDAGLGMRFTPSLPSKKRGKLFIGLRAGYVFDPIDNERWYRNGVRITGGPDSNLSGAYVRLTIGKTREKRCPPKGPCPHCKKPCMGKCPPKKAAPQQ